MATKTTNYNLTKPAYDEDADISVINKNMDIIDSKMKEIENASGGGAQITVDDQLSETSTNPVQNKVISSKMNELKSDIANSREAIAELADKKITKFYANSLGETTLNDSDNGKIQDMILYGKSVQDGTPTPDAPVEIKSVVNPVINVCGKNLLNPTLQTTTTNGVTCTNNGDGTYTLNGTASANTYFDVGEAIVNVPFKMIGCPKGKGAGFSTFGLGGSISPENADFGDGYSGTGLNEKRSITIFVIEGTTLTNVVFKPMITTDLNATYDDFEPYKEQTVTLPYTLNAIPVSDGGNVTIDGQEYIADYVDVERKKLVRCVAEANIDNCFNFIKYGSPTIYQGWLFECNLGSPTDSKGLCSYLKLISGSSHYNGDKIGFTTYIYGYLGISIDKSIESISEWIEENNVKMYYELATPTEIALTDEEIQAFKELATYYPTTNVMVTSEQLEGYTTFNYPISMANGWNYVKEQLGDTRDYIYDMDLQSAEAYVNSEYAVTLTELGV